MEEKIPIDICDKIFEGARNMLLKRSIELARRDPSHQVGEIKLRKIEIKNGICMATEKTLIYLPYDDGVIIKINNSIVREIYGIMETENLSHVIIAYRGITPQALGPLTVHAVKERVELFEYQRLLFDPTEHIFTPKQYVITEEEFKAELPSVKPEDLPSMLNTDVIAAFYGWTSGMVVKILRNNGSSIYYRRVVEDPSLI